MSSVSDRPAGIPGAEHLKGPFPVGAYARKVRDEMRARPRLQLFGEVWNLRVRRTKVWFELRDGEGAMACSMWTDEFERLRIGADALRDGVSVVVAGGPDYYPGSRTASPSFSFAVTGMRVAGEGDLLAQLDRLRKLLDGEGLFGPQKALARPALPRTIGVVTSDGGKAREDVLAALSRRGWAGRLVWGFAPVQDRHAAPSITRTLQDLAATGAVDIVIVARGGGSLADLFCFCDETLCRTVALLPVPVIASVGHHTDRTLLDDVAAVSCSTPTHAAEAAVGAHVGEARARMATAAARLKREERRIEQARPPIAHAAERMHHHAAAVADERPGVAYAAARLSHHAAGVAEQRPAMAYAAARLSRHAADVAAERPKAAYAAARLRHHAAAVAGDRPGLARFAERLERQGRRALVERARALAPLSRAAAQHIARERERLHQELREIRAATGRRFDLEGDRTGRRGLVLSRKAAAMAGERAAEAARMRAAATDLRRVESDATVRRRRHLETLAAALAAHDPKRTLERGYALVEDDAGRLVTTTTAARDARSVKLTFADGSVGAQIDKES
jgi:exodeoxyribonuclease VII large subunit